MAQPQFVSEGAYLDGSAASAQVEVPAGTAAGMVAVVTMFMDGAALAVNPTPSAGFQLAEGAPIQIPAGPGSHSLYVWWKRLTGADAGTYDFTWSESRYREAVATLYSDVVASGTPFDSPTDTAADSANSTVTPPVDVTSLGPDRLLVWSGTCWAGGTWTAPTSFAMRAQGGAGLFAVCDRAWPTAGASGPVSGTCTGSDKRLAWMGALIGTTGGTPSVAVTGRSTVAATGRDTVRKAAPASARAGCATAGAVTARKRSPVLGVGQAVPLPRGSARKAAPTAGRSSLAGVAAVAVTKAAIASGRAGSGVLAAAGAAKQSPTSGATHLAAWAYRSQISERAVVAICSALPVGHLSARKVLPASGLTVAAVGATAVAGHVANATGRPALLASAAASVRKTMTITGRAGALVTAFHGAVPDDGGAGIMSSRDRAASVAAGITRPGTFMASRPRRGSTMEGS